MEEWRDVVGYEGIYKISNKGFVYSHYSGKVLCPKKNRNGYMAVSLSKDKKKIRRDIHRLVAEAFIPNPDSKPEINHINGNKADNSSENLEWVTSSENKIHAYKTDLKKGYARKTSVIAIRLSDGSKSIYTSMTTASKELGINQGSISHSVNDGWAVGGYKFYRKESV